MIRATLLALPLALAATLPAAARDTQGYGAVAFPTSCAPAVQPAFDTALARLHDFDGPEDAFRAIAARDPHCAIAWWGAAMTARGNPLAGAPSREALEAGQAYIRRAQAAGPASPREAGLIAALATYYRNPAEDHAARTRAYEAAMRGLAARFPNDPDIQALHALAILEAVDLTDTTYARQREAGAILERLWPRYPGHPGIPHYLIHAYDYPPLAARALDAARRYAAIAPAAMHAQHMPSHIYSMLGLWQDSISANRMAAMVGDHVHTAAREDAADPHGMDFIAYAHLQLGQDDAVAAALALAGPSEERTLVEARTLLERGDWPGAAAMPLQGQSPLGAVTVRFVRALGDARTGQAAAARSEVAALRALKQPVAQADGSYWAGLVDVYADAAESWATFAAGDTDAAVRMMRAAADADDGRAKHILLENKLLPMRELLGEMLLATGQPGEALAAFDAALATAPNRFRSILGAARAAHALGRTGEAQRRYAQAAALTADAAPGRPDITEARRFASAQP